MSADQPEIDLKFKAGKYEEFAIKAIITLEFVLLGALVLVSTGWFYFSANAYWDTSQSVTDFYGAIPIMVGLGAGIFILTRMHEEAVPD